IEVVPFNLDDRLTGTKERTFADCPDIERQPQTFKQRQEFPAASQNGPRIAFRKALHHKLRLNLFVNFVLPEYLDGPSKVDVRNLSTKDFLLGGNVEHHQAS